MGVMLRSLLLVSLAGALLWGCSDHAGDLDAARNKQAPKRPDGGVEAPEVTPGVTPGSTQTPPPGSVTPGGACAPQAVAQLSVPPWRPPRALHAQHCSGAEATNLVNCYSGQQQQACDAQVTLPCHRCVVSDPTLDQTFGPIIFDPARPQDVEINVEGCVAALAGDPSAAGCGPKLQAANACRQQACRACEGQAAYSQCLSAAATGPCAQYETHARACSGTFLASCQQGQNAVQVALALTQQFCM